MLLLLGLHTMKSSKVHFSLLIIILSLLPFSISADVGNTYFSPISFKSKKVTEWQIKSHFRRLSTTESHRYDSSFTYSTGSQNIVSASRQFNTLVPQKVYAVHKTNNTAFQHYAEWLYIPSDVGTFTRMGWLLGQNQGFNMAVELEHRQMGREENTALSLGVNYVF
ncbi:hypothetical protein KUL42_42000 [Alteromonas sp. KUL42]|nr:hypothetical protein KUL42_42000 [Alteromonas sp. KUL42]